MASTKQEIIDDIKGYISDRGGDYDDWYVGVSKDAKSRLFDDHNVKEEGGSGWIYRTASSSNVAREIEDYFINTLGTAGGGGGGGQAAKMIYSYKKTSYTDP